MVINLDKPVSDFNLVAFVTIIIATGNLSCYFNKDCNPSLVALVIYSFHSYTYFTNFSFTAYIMHDSSCFF